MDPTEALNYIDQLLATIAMNRPQQVRTLQAVAALRALLPKSDESPKPDDGGHEDAHP